MFQFASGQEETNAVYSFFKTSLSEANADVSTFPYTSSTGQEAILFTPYDESVRFTIPGYDGSIPYDDANYLVIDLEHQNPASLAVLLEFKRKGDQPDNNGWVNARISVRIGVLPDLPTRLVFPLSYLSAQEVFLPKYPRQLKGTLNGKRMIKQEIEEVYIRLKNTSPCKYPQSASILGVYLFDSEPPELEPLYRPVVDSMGQWNARDWKGKMKSFEEYQEKISELESSFISTAINQDRSEYMGFKSLKFDSTGFFHTHHDGKRWWLVDPAGYAYLSVAPTGVRAFSHGPVEGNEDLFEWLPAESGLYAQAYAMQRGLKSLSFITINLMS